MKKYEFRSKTVWLWSIAIACLIVSLSYAYWRDRYELPILWGVYTAFLLSNSMRKYTLTSDTLTIKTGWLKPKVIFLKDLTEIDRKFYKNGKAKSIIIRYIHGGMPHNFQEIRKTDCDIEALLQAIQECYPTVRVI